MPTRMFQSNNGQQNSIQLIRTFRGQPVNLVCPLNPLIKTPASSDSGRPSSSSNSKVTSLIDDRKSWLPFVDGSDSNGADEYRRHNDQDQDRIELVFWYKIETLTTNQNFAHFNHSVQPIYSIDGRKSGPSKSLNNNWRSNHSKNKNKDANLNSDKNRESVPTSGLLELIASSEAKHHRSTSQLQDETKFSLQFGGRVGDDNGTNYNYSTRNDDDDNNPFVSLYLLSVQLSDAGLYKCRVDFRYARTRTQLIKLEVIELVSEIEIKIEANNRSEAGLDESRTTPQKEEVKGDVNGIDGKGSESPFWKFAAPQVYSKSVNNFISENTRKHQTSASGSTKSNWIGQPTNDKEDGDVLSSEASSGSLSKLAPSSSRPFTFVVDNETKRINQRLGEDERPASLLYDDLGSISLAGLARIGRQESIKVSCEAKNVWPDAKLAWWQLSHTRRLSYDTQDNNETDFRLTQLSPDASSRQAYIHISGQKLMPDWRQTQGKNFLDWVQIIRLRQVQKNNIPKSIDDSSMSSRGWFKWMRNQLLNKLSSIKLISKIGLQTESSDLNNPKTSINIGRKISEVEQHNSFVKDSKNKIYDRNEVVDGGGRNQLNAEPAEERKRARRRSNNNNNFSFQSQNLSRLPADTPSTSKNAKSRAPSSSGPNGSKQQQEGHLQSPILFEPSDIVGEQFPVTAKRSDRMFSANVYDNQNGDDDVAILVCGAFNLNPWARFATNINGDPDLKEFSQISNLYEAADDDGGLDFNETRAAKMRQRGQKLDGSNDVHFIGDKWSPIFRALPIRIQGGPQWIQILQLIRPSNNNNFQRAALKPLEISKKTKIQLQVDESLELICLGSFWRGARDEAQRNDSDNPKPTRSKLEWKINQSYNHQQEDQGSSLNKSQMKTLLESSQIIINSSDGDLNLRADDQKSEQAPYNKISMEDIEMLDWITFKLTNLTWQENGIELECLHQWHSNTLDNQHHHHHRANKTRSGAKSASATTTKSGKVLIDVVTKPILRLIMHQPDSFDFANSLTKDETNNDRSSLMRMHHIANDQRVGMECLVDFANPPLLTSMKTNQLLAEDHDTNLNDNRKSNSSLILVEWLVNGNSINISNKIRIDNKNDPMIDHFEAKPDKLLRKGGAKTTIRSPMMRVFEASDDGRKIIISFSKSGQFNITCQARNDLGIGVSENKLNLLVGQIPRCQTDHDHGQQQQSKPYVADPKTTIGQRQDNPFIDTDSGQQTNVASGIIPIGNISISSRTNETTESTSQEDEPQLKSSIRSDQLVNCPIITEATEAAAAGSETPAKNEKVGVILRYHWLIEDKRSPSSADFYDTDTHSATTAQKADTSTTNQQRPNHSRNWVLLTNSGSNSSIESWKLYQFYYEYWKQQHYTDLKRKLAKRSDDRSNMEQVRRRLSSPSDDNLMHKSPYMTGNSINFSSYRNDIDNNHQSSLDSSTLISSSPDGDDLGSYISDHRLRRNNFIDNDDVVNGHDHYDNDRGRGRGRNGGRRFRRDQLSAESHDEDDRIFLTFACYATNEFGSNRDQPCILNDILQLSSTPSDLLVHQNHLKTLKVPDGQKEPISRSNQPDSTTTKAPFGHRANYEITFNSTSEVQVSRLDRPSSSIDQSATSSTTLQNKSNDQKQSPSFNSNDGDEFIVSVVNSQKRSSQSIDRFLRKSQTNSGLQLNASFWTDIWFGIGISLLISMSILMTFIWICKKSPKSDHNLGRRGRNKSQDSSTNIDMRLLKHGRKQRTRSDRRKNLKGSNKKYATSKMMMINTKNNGDFDNDDNDLECGSKMVLVEQPFGQQDPSKGSELTNQPEFSNTEYQTATSILTMTPISTGSLSIDRRCEQHQHYASIEHIMKNRTATTIEVDQNCMQNAYLIMNEQQPQQLPVPATTTIYARCATNTRFPANFTGAAKHSGSNNQNIADLDPEYHEHLTASSCSCQKYYNSNNNPIDNRVDSSLSRSISGSELIIPSQMTGFCHHSINNHRRSSDTQTSLMICDNSNNNDGFILPETNGLNSCSEEQSPFSCDKSNRTQMFQHQPHEKQHQSNLMLNELNSFGEPFGTADETSSSMNHEDSFVLLTSPNGDVNFDCSCNSSNQLRLFALIDNLD